ALELDRARRLALRPPREHPGRAALLLAGTAGRRARGPADPGRRRSDAARAGRGAGVRARALPDARLLPALGGSRERGRVRARDHPRDADELGLRAPGTDDRPRQRGLDGEEETGGLLLSQQLRTVEMEAYLREREHKELLRFITCGSV